MSAPEDTLQFTREQLLRIIAGLQAAGGQAKEAIPLYRAPLVGLRLVRVIARDQAFPSALLAGSRPTLLTIGDDDFRSTGPSGWSCAACAVKWASAGGVMVYAGAARSDIYQHAVEGAQATGRLLLIETTVEHVQAWHALVPAGTPTLVVLPAFAAGPGQASPSETVH